MLNVKTIVNNLLRKDLVLIAGIGIPVTVFMILIGGGGHVPYDLDFETIDDSDTSEQTNQETRVQPDTIVPSTPDCDKSYPDFCIVPFPPDLDCDDIPGSNFRVVNNDPHGFDTDQDGIGCEAGNPSPAPPKEPPVPAVEGNN